MGNEVFMRLLQTAILIAAAAAAPALAVDSGLLRYVPSDAKSVAGVYADRVLGSPIGVFLRSQAGIDNSDFQKFVVASGFDPRRDLREVVFASTTPNTKGNGLAIARGEFNGAQIGALLQFRGGVKETVDGVDVYYTNTGRRGQAVAFPEPSVALAGDIALVKAAISAAKQSAALDPKLTAKIQTAGEHYDVWFASVGAQSLGIGKGFTAQESVDVVSGGAILGSVVQVTAEAVMRTEKDAQGLAGMIKLFTSMGQFQQRKNPQAEKLFAILNSAQTRIDGSTVSFTISAPEADLESLFSGSRQMAVNRQ